MIGLIGQDKEGMASCRVCMCRLHDWLSLFACMHALVSRELWGLCLSACVEVRSDLNSKLCANRGIEVVQFLLCSPSDRITWRLDHDISSRSSIPSSRNLILLRSLEGCLPESGVSTTASSHIVYRVVATKGNTSSAAVSEDYRQSNT